MFLSIPFVYLFIKKFFLLHQGCFLLHFQKNNAFEAEFQ